MDCKRSVFCLLAELDIAIEFEEDLLLELADGALAVEEIAGEEQGQHAKAKVGNAKSPFSRVFGMVKGRRVHKSGGGLRPE